MPSSKSRASRSRDASAVPEPSAFGQRHRHHRRHHRRPASRTPFPSALRAAHPPPSRASGCRRESPRRRTRPASRAPAGAASQGEGSRVPTRSNSVVNPWSSPHEMTARMKPALPLRAPPRGSRSCAAPRPTCGGCRRTSRRRAPACRARSRPGRARRRPESARPGLGSAPRSPRPEAGASCPKRSGRRCARRVRAGRARRSIASTAAAGSVRSAGESPPRRSVAPRSRAT